jgi:hypothetical protein
MGRHKIHYLGVLIVNKPSCLFDVSAQISKCYGSVHSILAQCNGVTKCAHILFYGLDAISVGNSIKDVVGKAWN